MFKQTGRFLVKLIIFLVFCAVGLGIGLAASNYFSHLEQSGAFVQWKLLDSPLKFRQFVYSNESEIWGYAENGRFYMYKSEFCQDTPGEACGKWMELDPHGEFAPEMKNVIRSGCEAVYNYYSVASRYPPQTEANPFECVITQAHHPFFGTTSLTYYVLLDNGQVWMWKHKIDFEKEITVSLSLTLVGLIVGIIAWLIFRKKFAHFINQHLGVTS